MKLKHSCALVLVLSLLCCCTVSVAAASVPGQYDVVDLLASGVFPDGELAVTRSASSYTFTWDVTASSSMAFVYLNIYAPSVPSSVTFNGISGTRVYSGAFYQYKFSVSKVLSTCTVKVNFGTTASRTVSIGYAVGAVSGQSVFTSFSRRSRGFSATSWSTASSVQIPGGGSFVSTISSDIPPNQRVNDFELSFDLNMASADYFTVHLLVPAGAGGMADGWRSAYSTAPSFFLGSSNTHTYPLNIINIDSYYDSATQIGYGRGSWHLVYTVDVGGYKLDSYDLMCCFSLFGVLKADTTSMYGFHFSCLSACLGVNVDAGDSSRGLLPWLSTQFSNLKSAITSLGTTITTQFSQLKTSLSGWFSKLGDRIEAAINPSSPELDEKSNQIDQGSKDVDAFEKQYQDSASAGIEQQNQSVSNLFTSFSSSFAFCSAFLTSCFVGLGDYMVLYTFPLYIGIILFVCNRVSNRVSRNPGRGRSRIDKHSDSDG